MYSNENKQVLKEETPVEDTITVSLGEYQKLDEEIEGMKRKKS